MSGAGTKLGVGTHFRLDGEPGRTPRSSMAARPRWWWMP
jgi:hypothetical protein